MKIFIFISFLFLNTFGNAQKHSISINYKPSLSYFGQQSQQFKHYYFFSRKDKPTFKNTINILYSRKVASRINLTTGLEYSQQGQNISFNADSAFPSSKIQVLKIELNYVRIPFIIQYSILKWQHSELSIFSGISLGFVTKRKDNYQNIILEYILLSPASKRYKNKDWALPIGVMYQKNLGPKVFAQFGLDYLIGLTNSFSERGFGVLSEFDNSRQRRLSLNVGVGIKLNK